MYALKNTLVGKKRTAEDRFSSGSADFVAVLPRVLRRPALFLNALMEGRVALPRHLGAFAVAGLFGLTGLYGVVQGGHLRALTEDTTSMVGFAIDRIDVAGNVETSPISIVQQLGLDGHTSLITMDVDDVRRMIMALPWVASADVRKVYPDVIDVRLTERQAFGIWQHGQALSLIEKNGAVISPLTNDKFNHLPLFVGFGADTHAETLLAAIDSWPQLRSRIKAYIRVADRRWDVRLDNGVTVRLPEHNMQAAIAKLRKYDDQQDLLERDIVSVDLRLSDRVTVGLSDEAVLRRAAALKERDTMLKSQERNS